MQDMISFGWWLGVAIVGSGVSVALPVVKAKIDAKRGKPAGPSAAFTAEVNKISASDSYRSLQVARIAHHYGKGAFLGLATLMLFFFGAAIQGAAGFISVLFFIAGVGSAVLATREMRFGMTSYEQMKAACADT